jgi:hypothetical protein
MNDRKSKTEQQKESSKRDYEQRIKDYNYRSSNWKKKTAGFASNRTKSPEMHPTCSIWVLSS